MIRTMRRMGVALIIYGACLAVVFAAARSPLWKGVRDAAVKAHPYCALCGSEKKLEGHHIKPYKPYPELELDPGNVAVLCRHCHFELGHGGISWDYENTNISVVLFLETGEYIYLQRKQYRESR